MPGNLFNIDTSGLGSLLGSVGSLAKDLRSVITGKLDPEKQAEFDQKVLELEQTAMNAQTAINAVEAASPSKFIAGARPSAMWLCIFGLAWATFIVPIWIWASAIWKLPAPPSVDSGTLVSLLVGLLGLSGLRTYEKGVGTSNVH